MLPKVAIVCANYNYGRFIVEGMKSIQSQTYKGEIRLYIVDDGSSDDSWEKISQFATEYPDFVFANAKYLKLNQLSSPKVSINIPS